MNCVQICISDVQAAAGRLPGLQRQMASYKLLILDELGYVPLSPSGAEMLFDMLAPAPASQ